MCGRYAIMLPPQAVRAYFAYVEQPNFPPRFNIAPTQPIPIVRAQRNAKGALERHFVLVRWGFLPSWVKDPKDFPLIINARDDALLDKASYRAAIRHKRCIVIADAFYEWRKTPASGGKPGPKRPYLIRRKSGEPLAFAGLWENWMGKEGEEIETACIVTTQANGLVGAIHDRMPVILAPDDFDAWLDVTSGRVEEAMKLVKPLGDDELEMFEVAPLVNKVANDGPDLQRPLADQPLPPPPAKTKAAKEPRQKGLFD